MKYFGPKVYLVSASFKLCEFIFTLGSSYMIFQSFLQNFYSLRNSSAISATQTYCFSFVILPQHFYRCISNQCPSSQKKKKLLKCFATKPSLTKFGKSMNAWNMKGNFIIRHYATDCWNEFTKRLFLENKC